LASGLALVLAAGLGVPVCTIFLAVPTAAHAQKNVPQERILEGKVVNKDGDPIAGAVVYLQNSGSSEIKTYIADNAGHYRFGNLSRVDDYQLWAESNGVRSKSHGISSFDDSNKFYIILKVNVSKPVSLDGPAVAGSTDLP
jgi:predicted peptidase